LALIVSTSSPPRTFFEVPFDSFDALLGSLAPPRFASSELEEELESDAESESEDDDDDDDDEEEASSSPSESESNIAFALGAFPPPPFAFAAAGGMAAFVRASRADDDGDDARAKPRRVGSAVPSRL
jgi:hypothetical protein